LDDLAFGLENVFLDSQRRQSIRFQPEHQRQVLRRDGFPENSGVFSRIGVALSADAGNPGWMSFGFDVLRSLEHHVLEEMGEPGAPRALVLRSDVIPDFAMDDRRLMTCAHN